MFLWDYRVTQATHHKPLRHTIDYRADQFTLSRFEIHSNTRHERKPDKAPANFRLQPICQKDAPSIYLSWPKYWATSISREIQLDSTDSTVSCSWDLLRRSQNKACGTSLVKPKNNLPPGEERALKQLINNKEISLKKEDKGTISVHTTVYKGERFEKESILDVRTHYKLTETLQYTNYNSCHPAGVKKGFVKGEALRLLRTNSSKVMFEENIKNFRTRLTSRGYPSNLVEKILSEVKFAERKNALTQKQKAHKKILPFVTQFHPSLPCLKNILTEK